MLKLFIIFLVCIVFGFSGCTTFIQNFNYLRNMPDIGPASFEPSGEEIVFSASLDGISNIYKVKLDGTETVAAITDSETYDSAPVFSPDGSEIVFLSGDNSEEADLCLMKSDGSNRVFLTNGKDHDYDPVFSPDGKKIFFLRASYFGSYSPVARPSWHEIDIYSINRDGTDLTRITKQNFYRIGNLSINKNGTTLMARIDQYKGPFSIWMIPIDNPGEAKAVQPNLDEYKIPEK